VWRAPQQNSKTRAEYPHETLYNEWRRREKYKFFCSYKMHRAEKTHIFNGDRCFSRQRYAHFKIVFPMLKRNHGERESYSELKNFLIYAREGKIIASSAFRYSTDQSEYDVEETILNFLNLEVFGGCGIRVITRCTDMKEIELSPS
jgi:hypothetical protein